MKPPGTVFSRFETELAIRPSDLDMNGHVHSSHYMDYVLAARYDQMGRCYGMAMDEFLKLGFGWVVRTAHLDFKRPLKLGDRISIGTWVEEITFDSVRVAFEIALIRSPANKTACDGWFLYTMVNTATGRGTSIPEEVRAVYSV